MNILQYPDAGLPGVPAAPLKALALLLTLVLTPAAGAAAAADLPQPALRPLAVQSAAVQSLAVQTDAPAVTRRTAPEADSDVGADDARSAMDSGQTDALADAQIDATADALADAAADTLAEPNPIQDDMLVLLAEKTLWLDSGVDAINKAFRYLQSVCPDEERAENSAEQMHWLVNGDRLFASGGDSSEYVAERQAALAGKILALQPPRLIQTTEENDSGRKRVKLRMEYPPTVTGPKRHASHELCGIPEIDELFHSIAEETVRGENPYTPDPLDYLGPQQEYTFDADVDFETAELVQYFTGRYTFGGGAHGVYFREFLLFERNGGTMVSFADLFENPALARALTSMACLENIIERKKREDMEDGVNDITYDSLEWMFNGLKDETFDNFRLTPDGLAFSFAEYQLGPFAEHITNAEVNLERLREAGPKLHFWEGIR